MRSLCDCCRVSCRRNIVPYPIYTFLWDGGLRRTHMCAPFVCYLIRDMCYRVLAYKNDDEYGLWHEIITVSKPRIWQTNRKKCAMPFSYMCICFCAVKRMACSLLTNTTTTTRYLRSGVEQKHTWDVIVHTSVMFFRGFALLIMFFLCYVIRQCCSSHLVSSCRNKHNQN